MNKVFFFQDKVRPEIHGGTYKQNIKVFFLRRITTITVKTLTFVSQIPVISRFLKFQRGKFGFFIRNTYFITHNSGLMSCSSTALSDITLARRKVLRVRSNFGMALYKNWLLRNNWKSFYRTPAKREVLEWDFLEIKNPPKDIHDWWIKDYSSIPVECVQEIKELFFSPSSRVQKLSERFTEKYNIILEETVGVHYRGTDKHKEIETPSLADFIERTRNSIKGMKNPRILLLTDEPVALASFNSVFPGIVLTVDELVSQGGSVGAHFLNSGDPEVQGQIFLATLSLVSKSNLLVTHTGNGALWEVLFRGNTENVTQINMS